MPVWMYYEVGMFCQQAVTFVAISCCKTLQSQGNNLQIFSFKFSNVCPSPMVIKLRVQRHFHIVADFFAVCLLCVNFSIFMRVISCLHKIFKKYFKKFIIISKHFFRCSWEGFLQFFNVLVFAPKLDFTFRG